MVGLREFLGNDAERGDRVKGDARNFIAESPISVGQGQQESSPEIDRGLDFRFSIEDEG
jgi:hypothetical protein